MKKKVFSAAFTCTLLAVMAAANVYAQMPGTAVRASIPFDFSVRGKILPAGIYQVKRIADGPEGLVISSVNGRHEHAAFETEPVEAGTGSGNAEIVFHRYGDKYFLSEVFAGGDLMGRELIPSREERSLRRELASNKTEAETVALAAY
ncbi:MAG: hypothetical protein JWM21_3150 [Acidobacteria bacterium]|nr:hypothetical protein [Acidobacteriota bacterium]